MSSIFAPELLFRARALLIEFERRALRLATAESCTGGLLCGLFTEIPGASNTVERGFVTYSNAAKMDLLGVDPDLIQRVGAVSAEVACAMAEGALTHAPVQFSIAVTGIAGPGGDMPGKPVGLVFIAVAATNQQTRTIECRFGDIGRTEVRLASLAEALALAEIAVAQTDPR